MREDHFIICNGLRLHVVTAGPNDGSPVLMLHGAPEFWRCWHHQMDALSAQGYRVIVPDQRGYNLSDKPQGVANYQIDKLVEDIVALVNTLNYDQVDLIAHDWGATVALHVAERFPQRIKHLVVSNGVHLNLMARSWLRHPLQIAKGWYILFFQIPWLPDYFMRRGLGMWFIGSSNPGSFSEDELALYRQAWAQPNAVTAMINWYRAAFRSNMRETFHGLLRFRNPYNLFPPPVISVPTLILWGENDAFLTKKMAETLAKTCQSGQLQYFPDATHWLPSDKPDKVSQSILEFIRG